MGTGEIASKILLLSGGSLPERQELRKAITFVTHISEPEMTMALGLGGV